MFSSHKLLTQESQEHEEIQGRLPHPSLTITHSHQPYHHNPLIHLHKNILQNNNHNFIDHQYEDTW